jgi:hypothetical protein
MTSAGLAFAPSLPSGSACARTTRTACPFWFLSSRTVRKKRWSTGRASLTLRSMGWFTTVRVETRPHHLQYLKRRIRRMSQAAEAKLTPKNQAWNCPTTCPSWRPTSAMSSGTFTRTRRPGRCSASTATRYARDLLRRSIHRDRASAFSACER